MQLTFEMLPEAVGKLYYKLENIERLLQQQGSSPSTESEDLLTVQQAAEFLKLSVPTVYGLVSRREIPAMKKTKRLYFSKHELSTWIKTGRKLTIAETEREVDNYLNNYKKKGAIR